MLFDPSDIYVPEQQYTELLSSQIFSALCLIPSPKWRKPRTLELHSSQRNMEKDVNPEDANTEEAMPSALPSIARPVATQFGALPVGLNPFPLRAASRFNSEHYRCKYPTPKFARKTELMLERKMIKNTFPDWSSINWTPKSYAVSSMCSPNKVYQAAWPTHA